MRLWHWSLFCTFALIASCQGVDVTKPELSVHGGQTPMCQTGCVDTDPFPNRPGVFAGSAVIPDFCIAGPYTDADQDGLGDYCETVLANAFTPELAYTTTDNTGREPHWIARALPGDTVRIAYLLSYYVDLGTDHPSCHTAQLALLVLSFGFVDFDPCASHAGDSEHIVLDVTYNAVDQHWVLRRAYYSEHLSHNVYVATNKPWPTSLSYPVRAGGYPRSYVAYGKHANYASDAECDAGGALGLDYCSPNVYARLIPGTNLGSRAFPFLNCMGSSHPVYAQNGVTECYWTNTQFSGWQGYQPAAPGYSSVVADFGF